MKKAKKSRIIEIINQLIEDDAKRDSGKGTMLTQISRYYLMVEVRELCGGEGPLEDEMSL